MNVCTGMSPMACFRFDPITPLRVCSVAQLDSGLINEASTKM